MQWHTAAQLGDCLGFLTVEEELCSSCSDSAPTLSQHTGPAYNGTSQAAGGCAGAARLRGVRWVQGKDDLSRVALGGSSFLLD